MEMRILAPASSIKSIALSGKKRPWIYRSDKMAAALNSLSSKNALYDAFHIPALRPLRISIVSSTVGGAIKIF